MPASVLLSAFQSIESGLKRYVMRYVVREQDIEDIVQETFLRAYEAEQSMEIRSPKSFLFRIARNIALSELARKSSRLTTLVGDLDAFDVIDDRPSTDEEVETHQRLEMLRATIGTLPPRCQSVLVMRKVLGFSHKEIASRMDISVRTVEKHLAKALKRCQESRGGDSAPESRTAGATDSIRVGVQDD